MTRLVTLYEPTRRNWVTQIEAFLGLGGNIGDTRAILLQALQQIEALPSVSELRCASFYQSSPVSDIPQEPYINTVCRVLTNKDYQPFVEGIRSIEANYGRDRSQKNAPRVLDIDLLFFGSQAINELDLVVPHPRWNERLFVLAPLADLTSSVSMPDGSCICVANLIEEFPYKDQQWVIQDKSDCNSLIGKA